MRTAEVVERPNRCADVDPNEFLEIEPRREQCRRTALKDPELEYVARFGIGPEEARRSRLVAGSAIARLDKRTRAAFGFSQGAMTALHVAPRRRRALAGVLGFSGALLGGERLAAEAQSRPPVYLVHGDADEVVPVAATYAAVAGLQAAGIPVQWSIRRGLPHGIDPESVAHGGAFLAAAFAARQF